MSKKINQFSFTELAAGEVKKIDCLSAGTFWDMWGREAVFLPEELPIYAQYSNAALESTRDSSGEVVGFPIDQGNHDHGEAAGFMFGFEHDRERNVITASVRWNEEGERLIGANLVRYFSPSVDMGQKVIFGGSLTNYPASRDAQHNIKLRPVEMSAGMFTCERDPMGFGEELKLAISEALKPVIELFTGRRQPVEESNQSEKGEATMSKKIADFVADPGQAAELQALIDERVKTGINTGLEAALAMEKRKAEVHQFCATVCGGTEEKPHGLPLVPAELEASLIALPEDQAKQLQAMLQKIHDAGAVKFTETGHNADLQGKTELPDWAARLLSKWIAEKGELEAFFKMNANELGAMEDYDLSAYAKKED